MYFLILTVLPFCYFNLSVDLEPWPTRTSSVVPSSVRRSFFLPPSRWTPPGMDLEATDAAARGESLAARGGGLAARGGGLAARGAEAAPGALATASPGALASAFLPPAAPPSLSTPPAMDLEATEALPTHGALAAASPGALASVSPGALAAAPDGQASQAGATNDLQPAVEASIDALALARSLLPTAPHPARECNIPVLQVQRYILHPLDLLFFFSTITIQK